jgi:AraC family transcriptional regulator
MRASSVFRHGEFIGDLRRSWIGSDIALSHRVAAGDVEPHRHEDGHFIWVTGGQYVTSARGDPGERQPIFVYNPPDTHHRDHFGGGTGSFFAISIAARHIRKLAAKIALPDAATHIARNPVRDIARMLLHGPWNDCDAALDIESLTIELLDGVQACRSERTSKPPRWLARARELLHDCCADDLVLAEIATQLGVHPVHLTRTFRSFFRCTPGGFLRSCRLERAADLLLRSHQPLCNVALASGFADQSHFTKRFRAAYGVPPGEYRELASARRSA